MSNRDNVHDIDICPDQKITKRSEPKNQAQAKINIAKGLKTFLNDLKDYLATYHISYILIISPIQIFNS